jgi:hypothetical protein
VFAQKLCQAPRGVEMLSWRSRRRERIAFAEAVADALVCEFGVQAYRKARQAKCDATTQEMTAHWSQVALVIARRLRSQRRSTAVPILPER